MPRLLTPSIFRGVRQSTISSRRSFALSQQCSKEGHGSASSTPGYEGKHTDEHVVHRKDELDVQAGAAQSGMRQQEKREEGSQGLSRKDEGNYNKKAKEDHPEAPGPVLGMNDERGNKGH